MSIDKIKSNRNITSRLTLVIFCLIPFILFKVGQPFNPSSGENKMLIFLYTILYLVIMVNLYWLADVVGEAVKDDKLAAGTLTRNFRYVSVAVSVLYALEFLDYFLW